MWKQQECFHASQVILRPLECNLLDFIAALFGDQSVLPPRRDAHMNELVLVPQDHRGEQRDEEPHGDYRRDQIYFPFRDPNGTAYVDFYDGISRLTFPVRSREFAQFLRFRTYSTSHHPAKESGVQTNVRMLEAAANFGPNCLPVFWRVAHTDSEIVIDVSDDARSVVIIDGQGWYCATQSEARFIRHDGMLPIPALVRGGRVNFLRPFLNLACETDFDIVVAWLLSAQRGRAPFPVLVLTGPQGSAKSTAARILLSLIDPKANGLMSLPSSRGDLAVTLANGFAFAFDNITQLHDWQSDFLCQVSTGGTFTTRKFQTNTSQVSIALAAPVILTGIEEFVTRSDLADRTLMIPLKAIGTKTRMTEAEIWSAFEQVRPAILGALYDAVSWGLQAWDQTHPKNLPRLADFSRWAQACEPGWTQAGNFASA